MKCPFCNEGDYDLVGLKAHLTGEGLLFAGACKVFEDTFTIAEESNLRKIRRIAPNQEGMR